MSLVQVSILENKLLCVVVIINIICAGSVCRHTAAFLTSHFALLVPKASFELTIVRAAWIVVTMVCVIMMSVQGVRLRIEMRRSETDAGRLVAHSPSAVWKKMCMRRSVLIDKE